MIDYEIGLHYCGDDGDFYKSILCDFVNESDNRLANLEKAYDSCNWSDYRLTVHSIKSVAALIGAILLSEKAEEHQNAVESNDIAFIRSDYASLRSEYVKVLNELSTAFKD